MFNSYIEIETEALIGMCLIDHTTVDIYPFDMLEKPMSVLPLFLAAVEHDKFFDHMSSVEINLKEVELAGSFSGTGK